MINFANHVCQWAKTQPSKIAVHDGVYDLCYSELATRIYQLANHLRPLGVGKHIVISMEDCVDWPVSFLACVYNGQVPIPLSPAVGESLLETLIDYVDAVMIIAGEKTSEKLAHHRARLTRHDLARIFQQPVVNIDPVMVHPDSAGFMAFSSGTTNTSKAAVHRHQSFFEALKIAPLNYNLTNQSRLLSTPKMSWGWGMLNSLVCSLGVGATSIVISDVPVAATVIDYANRYQPDFIISSPSVIRRLIKHPGKLPPTVKSVHSAGEDLPRPWFNEFYKKYNIAIQCEFGQLETWISFCCQMPNNIEPGTVGKLLPGCEFQILNSNKEKCAVDEVGEIYARTPTSALYYYKNWAKTKATFHGEWVKTGDLGSINQNGNLVFAGRVDDVFKVNAMIVVPVEIENTILQDNTVEHVAVAGIPNNHGIKELHVFVVPGENFNKTDFTIFLKKNLFSHQIPKYTHIVDVLPETTTSKKVRTNLQNYLEKIPC